MPGLRGDRAMNVMVAPMAHMLEQDPSNKLQNMGELAVADNPPAGLESVAVQVQLFLVIDLLTLHFYLN